jgi:hypothetical protein
LNRCWCGLERCHGDPGGLVGREAIHAGGDRGEGDGPGAESVGELRAASVAGGQDVGFAVVTAFPDRPNRL